MALEVKKIGQNISIPQKKINFGRSKKNETKKDNNSAQKFWVTAAALAAVAMASIYALNRKRMPDALNKTKSSGIEPTIPKIDISKPDETKSFARKLDIKERVFQTSNPEWPIIKQYSDNASGKIIHEHKFYTNGICGEIQEFSPETGKRNSLTLFNRKGQKTSFVKYSEDGACKTFVYSPENNKLSSYIYENEKDGIYQQIDFDKNGVITKGICEKRNKDGFVYQEIEFNLNSKNQYEKIETFGVDRVPRGQISFDELCESFSLKNEPDIKDYIK